MLLVVEETSSWQRHHLGLPSQISYILECKLLKIINTVQMREPKALEEGHTCLVKI